MNNRIVLLILLISSGLKIFSNTVVVDEELAVKLAVKTSISLQKQLLSDMRKQKLFFLNSTIKILAVK